METILIELRRYDCLDSFRVYELIKYRYMALPQHKKLPQPQEGTTF
jgi:hypothetical protein